MTITVNGDYSFSAVFRNIFTLTFLFSKKLDPDYLRAFFKKPLTDILCLQEKKRGVKNKTLWVTRRSLLAVTV